MSVLEADNPSMQYLEKTTREEGVPKHREIVTAMAQYANSQTSTGFLLFAVDLSLYAIAIAVVLLVDALWVKVLASLFAGVKIANLATLAHDAAHGSLTPSRRLNWWIGVFAFLPGLFNFRLWVYDHHMLHHPHTNGEHIDSYRPLSKAEYDRLGTFRQWWVRFHRSPNPLAFGIYYIAQRWWRVKLKPGSFLPKAYRASARKHCAFVLVYFVGFIALLVAAPRYSNTGPATAVLLGFAVPFFVFQSVLAFSLYFNHTHPKIPWFENEEDRRRHGRHQETMTVHLRLPLVLARLSHHFYEHPAHHVYPAIPCYRLWAAQARLNDMLGSKAVVEPLSLRFIVQTMRACQLYDYENHRWLDFDGRPTSPILITA